MKKEDIRNRMLKKRQALSESEIKEKSQAIQKKLEGEEEFKQAKTILFYHSHKKEVMTPSLIQRSLKNKTIYLPILKAGNQFDLGECESLSELKPNVFQIPEPTKALKEAPPLDLIIIPGVAFDLFGNRIGMGKGYYDRFLAKNKSATRIAIAFEEQILDQIPKGPYDENVELIITEKRVIRCK